MAAPDIARYRPGPNAAMLPDDEGPCVFFKDIEDALTDRKMLDWVMPIIGGEDTRETERKTTALMHGLVRGHTGRALLVFAMELAP